MTRFLFISIILVSSSSVSGANKSATKKFTSGYNISLELPADWQLDSKTVRDAKVRLSDLLTTLRSDGKIRVLNTGTAPASPVGYARVRLSVISNEQLSQEEARDLTESELDDIKAIQLEQLAQFTIPRIDLESVAVTKTRADKHYWAYRVSYTRSGLNGPVRAEQYYIPFSNRAILLTLSYQLSNEEVLAPILLRIFSSLKLDDEVPLASGRQLISTSNSSQNMTFNEITRCNGYTVQVELDGKEALGELIVTGDRILLRWPAPDSSPPSAQWDDRVSIPLTVEDIENLTQNGLNSLFSKIRLTSEGGKHRIA